MKTYMQKTAEIKRAWHLVDVQGRILGQVAADIAIKLMGKHRPTYTPHIDGGDYVVVVNAAAVAVTGNKLEDKMYYDYSGFPGGLRKRNLATLQATQPEQVIERAVYNMLPKNKLRAERMRRLKVYTGTDHKHLSQLGMTKEVGTSA